jgi:hypothetical protein
MGHDRANSITPEPSVKVKRGRLDSKGGLAKVREIKIDGVVGGRIHILAGTPANILPVVFVTTAITDG